MKSFMTALSALIIGMIAVVFSIAAMPNTPQQPTNLFTPEVKAQFKTITDENLIEAAGGKINIIIPIDWPDFTKDPYVVAGEWPTSAHTGIAGYSNSVDTYYLYYMAVGPTEKYRIIIYGMFGKTQYYVIEDDGGFPRDVAQEVFQIHHDKKVKEAAALNSAKEL
jgi:hypothetical protein